MARYRSRYGPIAAAALLVVAAGAMTMVQASATTTPSPGASALAATAGCGKSPTLASGTHSIQSNGKNRSFILRVPANYDSNHPYRLIFAFHWVGGTANDVSSGGTDKEAWSYYGLGQLSNNSAILVAPQGLNNGWGNSGGEDVTFVDNMIKQVEGGLCVDTGQLFSVGFSYGGAMTYALACARASVFRAVAVYSGGQLSGCSGGTQPIAYLGIHGIGDGTLNISGGRAMRDTFVRNNGCTAQNPPEPRSGSLTHILTEYSGCRAGYPVQWAAFDGGHTPGPVDGGGDSGARTWTKTAVWKFFSQFQGGSSSGTAQAANAAAATLTNPPLWQDFADDDIIRVGDTFYDSASTMHYSPGAPILRSYDLVNWEVAGHSVPSLDFDSNAYNLGGGRAYVKGIWASAFNYRTSNSTFYWIGCVEFNRTYVYTSTSIESGWAKRAKINNCYYDAGLLIDNDDTMYVAYGNTTLSVAQLSADGLSEVKHQQVFSTPSSVGTLEGSKFYKRGNYYYIFSTRPANGQYVMRSTSPWGPYEMRQVLLNMGGPISGGGVPHQGGMVQTRNGDWYYLAFQDAYPGGRVPVIAPINWSADGWPTVQTVNGAWGASYPAPNVPATSKTTRPATGTDTFGSSTLGPDWEWNHNPDATKWSSGGGLRLQTATVTNDLYSARNTLTRRILGPTSTATIQLDYSTMRDGDRAGLAMLRQSSAWIGLRRDNGATRVVMTNGLTMDGNWNTTGTGTEVAGAGVSGGRIWLRVNADVRPGTGRQARFSYSTDGTTFTNLGSGFTLDNSWQFFMGYRYGIFNYATQAAGGAVTVNSFQLSTP